MVLSKTYLLIDWKKISDVFAPYLSRIWNNEIIEKHQFLDKLKPVLKKKDRNIVKKYRYLSILMMISKIFERNRQKPVVSCK